MAVGNWIIAQVSMQEDVFNRVFEFSMSLGILVLVLIYLFYENKTKDNKKDKAQDDLVDILKTNIKVIGEFSETNKDIVKSVERGTAAQTEAIDRMTKAFEKMESKL